MSHSESEGVRVILVTSHSESEGVRVILGYELLGMSQEESEMSQRET